MKSSMNRFAVAAVAVVALLSAVAAQTTASFAGTWEGNFKMQRSDGTEGPLNPVVFNLTQKGKVLTGTAGPADRQWKVEKGAVDAWKAR